MAETVKVWGFEGFPGELEEEEVRVGGGVGRWIIVVIVGDGGGRSGRVVLELVGRRWWWCSCVCLSAE